MSCLQDYIVCRLQSSRSFALREVVAKLVLHAFMIAFVQRSVVGEISILSPRQGGCSHAWILCATGRR